MAVTILSNDMKPFSYLALIGDVFIIFMSGIYFLLLYRLYTKNVAYFIIGVSIYFIILNIYTLLYLHQIKDPVLLKSIHHRLLNFIGIYNIFLAIFMMLISFMMTSTD